MRYMGGKSRIGKKLGAILNEYLDGKLDFVEPFVGGFNIVPHIQTTGRIECGDANGALIHLYRAIQDGWTPPENVSEEEYQLAKTLPDTDPQKAFCGIGCSFGGKWFGGYARDGKRNFAKNCHNALAKKAEHIKRAGLWNCDYFEIWNYDMPQSVIYCDPPYEGTTRYDGAKGFNHAQFWDWCAHMARRHYVFVSEYRCPISHRVVFEKEQTTTVSRDKMKYAKATEKMFLCEGFE